MVHGLWVSFSCAVLLLTCAGGSGVCHAGDSDCGPEDASLLQLRPDKSVRGAAVSGSHTTVVQAHWQGHGSPKCPDDDQPAVLGELDGKELKLNWQTYTPLDVPAGSSLTLLLCNIENRQTSPPVGPHQGPLVQEVGDRAHVYVLVANSFNVYAKGDVFVGPQNMSSQDVETISKATVRHRNQLERRRSDWERLDGRCPVGRRRRRRRASLLQEAPEEELELEPEVELEGEPEVNQTLEERENEKEKKKEEHEKEKKAAKGPPAALLSEEERVARKASTISSVPMYYQVPPVVGGPVGKGAIIQVTVKDSGNVATEAGKVALHEATLVGAVLPPGAPPITTPGGVQFPGLEAVIVQVGVFNSGNVLTKGGAVEMARSFLLSPTISAYSLSSVDINVHLEASGKVEAKVLTMAGADDHGALVGNLLYADYIDAKDCKVSVTLVDTANVELRSGSGSAELIFVQFPQMKQPRLMDALIHLVDSDLKGFNIDVLLSSSGNVRLPGGDILGVGFLMDPALDECRLKSSSMRFTMLNSGNLEAGAWYVKPPSDFQKLWIDELVYLYWASHLDFKGVVANSANFRVQQLELANGNSNERSAIGEVIFLSYGSEPGYKNDLEATVTDSANWEGKLLISPETQFSLIENAIDVNHDLVDSHLSVSVSGSANARGGVVCLQDELFDDPIDGEDFNHSVIVALVSDSASVTGSRFEMRYEDLIDELVDVRKLADTQVTLKITSVANVEADDVVLYDSGELVETFMDSSVLEPGTTIVLGITNCGNVKAKHLSLSEESYLLQDVMEGTFVAPTPVTITIASSGNFQGPGSAEIFEDSILIRHVIDPQDDTPKPPEEEKEFGQTSITLTESASLQTQKASLSSNSFLLGQVVDGVPGSGEEFTDLSLLKSLSMFATAVGNDRIKFEGQSAPCQQGDLPKFALPFAYSCVPLP